MTNTPQQAEENARQQSLHGPKFGIGLCLQRVRILYGVAAKYPDAAKAWHYTVHKHTDGSVPPRGALVWWTGGSADHGHVALSTGGGWCWSTDIKRPGYFDLVPTADIARKWGMKYVGWSEDINGVRVIRVPLNTPWRRTRRRLLAVLRHEDALNIKRVRIRAFLATVRAGIKSLPRD